MDLKMVWTSRILI